MAKKKVVEKEEVVEDVQDTVVVPTKINHVSVDFGREDINTLARTLNQVIDVINSNE